VRPDQGLKGQGAKFGRLPSHNAEVKNDWSSTSTPAICLRGVDRDFMFDAQPVVLTH
jgi:hypothetical protein